MTARPDRLIVVVGTATEVGKTWVAARLLASEDLARPPGDERFDLVGPVAYDRRD